MFLGCLVTVSECRYQLKVLILHFICTWNKSWMSSGTLRSSMQGARKIEKSVVGMRNCVNWLGIKLSNSQARRGQFVSGLKTHIILNQGPFQRDNNNDFNNNFISFSNSSFHVDVNKTIKSATPNLKLIPTVAMSRYMQDTRIWI